MDKVAVYADKPDDALGKDGSDVHVAVNVVGKSVHEHCDGTIGWSCLIICDVRYARIDVLQWLKTFQRRR